MKAFILSLVALAAITAASAVVLEKFAMPALGTFPAQTKVR